MLYQLTAGIMYLKTVTDKRIMSGINRVKYAVLQNRKGSYIVESAIVLPVFLIAVIVMSSVILMYACIENCNFMTAVEMRNAQQRLYTQIHT